MFREKLKHAVWFSGIYTFLRFVYSLVDAIGNWQTANALIPEMPEFAQWVVRILYWPLTGPIVCIGCLFAMALLDRRRATISSNTVNSSAVAPKTLIPETQQSVHGREMVDVTPGYLIGLFDQHTSIQAQRLVEPYIGKWMKLSGPLADVSGNDQFSMLTFDRLALGWPGLVFMYFRQPDRNARLSVLRRGSNLTVIGQIDRVSSVDLQLNNCELT